MESKHYGKYIAVEGIVRNGKSTIARRLTESLERHFAGEKDVIMVREPGGTPIAEAIRTVFQESRFQEEMSVRCEAMLAAAARAQLIGTVVYPALRRGDWVVGDRCLYSTTVIQGMVKGMPLGHVESLHFLSNGSVRPDLVLVYDMPAEVATARVGDVAGDRFEGERLDFWMAVRNGYLQLASESRGTFEVVDAQGQPDEVFVRTLEVVNKWFCLGALGVKLGNG